MKTLSSEIEIAAPAGVVWQVLTDFAVYQEWNPVEIRMAGEPVAETVLEHTSKLPGRKPMQFRPIIVEATPGRVQAWEGRLFMPGLFDVHHRFEIEALQAQRTRLRQLERFRGVLFPFSGSTLRKTQEAFEITNRAIKLRVENGSPTPDDSEASAVPGRGRLTGRGRRPRPRFAEMVGAAKEILDRDDPDALTMRNVGDWLGIWEASLYKHRSGR